MSSLKHGLRIIPPILFSFLAVVLISCDAQMSGGNGLPNTITSSNATSSTASVATATDDTPYRFDQAQQICWENKVRTNGPSFGAAGNSGYFCYGGGASYSNSPYGAYPNDITWIGFYRDGTISIRDQAGVDHVYTPSFPVTTMACELDLMNPDNSVHAIIGPVNYPGYPTNILDASNHMQYMEVQTSVNGTLDSGSLWTCEYAAQFGIQ